MQSNTLPRSTYLGPSADSPSFGRVASVLGLRLGHIGSSRDYTLSGEVG